MGVWGGSGTEWGPESSQDPKRSLVLHHFGGPWGRLGNPFWNGSGQKSSRKGFEGAILQIWWDFWDFEGPFGRPFGIKNLNFFLIRFLIKFGFNFGRGRRQGRTPPEPQEPQDLRNCICGIGTPFTPCGVGADPKASPLPPAPLATSWLLICRLDGFERFVGLKSLEN